VKIALALLALAGGFASFALQEREKPVTDAERTRFLFSAIYEGLIEDGAVESAVKPIVDRRDEWFVPKCPICDPVYSAFRAYLGFIRDHGWKSERTDGLPDWFGSGLSKETVKDLADPEVKTRHAAFQALVDKYVKRRFASVVMSAERKDRMQESLKIGMKEGIVNLKQSDRADLFPSSCPSCEGAN
jgi:hypothetical protein